MGLWGNSLSQEGDQPWEAGQNFQENSAPAWPMAQGSPVYGRLIMAYGVRRYSVWSFLEFITQTGKLKQSSVPWTEPAQQRGNESASV